MKKFGNIEIMERETPGKWKRNLGIVAIDELRENCLVTYFVTSIL